MNSRPDSTILSAVVGSTAHGLSIEGEDDRDIMGIFVEPPQLVCGIDCKDHHIYRTAPKDERSRPGDEDHVYYSLRKFSALAAGGNPSILTLLFSRPDELTPVGSTFLAHRHYFITRQAGPRYLGYLRSQRARLLRDSGKPRRPDLVKKYGYDTKYAMHMIRLGFQGVELMRYGRITLPMRPFPLTICRNIRLGVTSEKAALAEVRNVETHLEHAIEESDLPPRPNRGDINQLLWNLHHEYWHHGHHP